MYKRQVRDSSIGYSTTSLAAAISSAMAAAPLPSTATALSLIHIDPQPDHRLSIRKNAADRKVHSVAFKGAAEAERKVRHFNDTKRTHDSALTTSEAVVKN